MGIKTETKGVNYVQRIVEDELGWIFRRLDYQDHGIDAHIEFGDEAKNKFSPFGNLIAVQVKSGESYCQNIKNENIVLTLKSKRWIDYWKDYTIPVILILYSPLKDLAYWCNAEDYSLIEESQRYFISLKSIFDNTARSRLIITAYSKKYHLIPSGSEEIFKNLLHLAKNSTNSQNYDNEVRRLLFDLQNKALLDGNVKDKSLYAVDTSLEEFHPTAWFDDKSYSDTLNILLSIARVFNINNNIIQIYSLNSNRVTPDTISYLYKLLIIHKNHGIKVGFLRRDFIDIELDRDFSIVNKSFVLECKVSEWAKSTPQLSKSAVNFFSEIFNELVSKAIFFTSIEERHYLEALKEYYR